MPSFTPSKDIPLLTDKVILVTGGNSGLGKQSIIEFARYGKPAKIFLAARSTAKANEAIAEIKQAVPEAPPIVPLDLDLTSFESIKAAAKAFTQQSDRLDILMLNAGIMTTPEGQTKEGYEIQFGTNHVGHALFAKLLLPTLRATAARPEHPDVRVVVLTSAGLALAPSVGFDPSWVKTDGSAVTTYTRYGQSKMANALFARELARREPELTVVSVHPGVVNTNLLGPFSQGGILKKAVASLIKLVITGVENGAKNQVWASVAKDVKSGEYYTPVGVVGSGRGTALARNDELAKKLWDWTEEELKGQEI